MINTHPIPPATAGPAATAAPVKHVGPPTKHQLALMIWVAVFPTLTVLNLTLTPHLSSLGPIPRTSSWPPSPCRSSSTDSCRSSTKSGRSFSRDGKPETGGIPCGDAAAEP